MRERRSLWGSISMSEKVNSLSLAGALLYTWTIPHEDDFGYIEADPRYLKAVVVPFRKDISERQVKKISYEISRIHEKVGSLKPLWTIYTVNGKEYIKDEYFEERQSFKGIHRQISKIKRIIEDCKTAPVEHPSNTQQGADGVPKLSEEKLSEEKLSEVKENEAPKHLISSLSYKLQTPSKTLDPISRKAELKRQAQELLAKGD
jgi:hypothetical protein